MKTVLKILIKRGVPLINILTSCNCLNVIIPRKIRFSGHFRLNTVNLNPDVSEIGCTN